jgi:hypothetical protein
MLLLTVIVTLQDPTPVIVRDLVVEVLAPAGMVQPAVPDVAVQEKFSGPGPEALPWRVTLVKVRVAATAGVPDHPSAVELIALKLAPLGLDPAAAWTVKVWLTTTGGSERFCSVSVTVN